MNIPQNRTRLFEILAGLLATQFIVLGLGYYMLNEPARIIESQTQIQQIQLDDAMTLYAQNCSVCHGLSGEGISRKRQTPPQPTAVPFCSAKQAIWLPSAKAVW